MPKFYVVSDTNFKAVLFDEVNLEKAKELKDAKNITECETEDTVETLIGKMVSGKLYAVKNGIINGIYFSWNTCKSMVDGFPNAQYKGFLTFHECTEFIGINQVKEQPEVFSETVSTPYAYVDGSYNEETKVYGYGVILVHGNNEYEFYGSGNDPDMTSMRNVAGEILGSQRAITEAIAMGLNELTIYYDYQGIEMWATGQWKRNKIGTIAYYDFINSTKELIKINFTKVKAHSGVKLNEVVDKLAKQAVGIKD